MSDEIQDEIISLVECLCEKCGQKVLVGVKQDEIKGIIDGESCAICYVCERKWKIKRFGMKIISIDGVEQKRDNE